MNRLKNILYKVLNPPIKIIVISAVIAFPLVIYALNYLPEIHPVSFLAYFLSSYSLAVLLIGMKRIVLTCKDLVKNDKIKALVFFKSLMRKNKYTARYLDDRDFRAKAGIYAGLAINLLYGFFKGVTGAVYDSPWLWSMGIYYLALGGIRFMLMRNVRKQLPAGDEAAVKLHEYKTYRRCGAMMMLMNITVAGLAIQMIWQNKANEYSRVVVIISAAYTFYSFILSLVNMISFRKRNNAILSAAKDLTFCGAVMSVLSLQSSMLYAFDEGKDNSRQIFNSITGGFVIAIVLAISTYMIIHGTNKINTYTQKN